MYTPQLSKLNLVYNIFCPFFLADIQQTPHLRNILGNPVTNIPIKPNGNSIRNHMFYINDYTYFISLWQSILTLEQNKLFICSFDFKLCKIKLTTSKMYLDNTYPTHNQVPTVTLKFMNTKLRLVYDNNKENYTKVIENIEKLFTTE